MAILLKFRRVRQITGLFLKIVIVIAVIAVVFVVVRGLISNLKPNIRYAYGVRLVAANPKLFEGRKITLAATSPMPLEADVALIVGEGCDLCRLPEQKKIIDALMPYELRFGTIKFPDKHSDEAKKLTEHSVLYWEVPPELNFLDKLDGTEDGVYNPLQAYNLIKDCASGLGDDILKFSFEIKTGSELSVPWTPWFHLNAPFDYGFEDTRGVEWPAGKYIILSLPYLNESNPNLCANLPGVTPGISLQQIQAFLAWDANKMDLPQFMQEYPEATGSTIFAARRAGILQWLTPLYDPLYEQRLEALTPVIYQIDDSVYTMSAFWTVTPGKDNQELVKTKQNTCPFTWVIDPHEYNQSWFDYHLLTRSQLAAWYTPGNPDHREAFVRKVKEYAQSQGWDEAVLETEPAYLDRALFAGAFAYMLEKSNPGQFQPIDVVNKAHIIQAGGTGRGWCAQEVPEVLGEPKGEALLYPLVYGQTGEGTYEQLIRLRINQLILDETETQILGKQTKYYLGPAGDFVEVKEKAPTEGKAGAPVGEVVFGELPEVPASEPEGTEGLLVANQNGRLVVYDPNNNEVGLPSHWQLRIRYQIVDSERAVITWTDTPSPTQFAGFTIKLENIKTE